MTFPDDARWIAVADVARYVYLYQYVHRVDRKRARMRTSPAWAV